MQNVVVGAGGNDGRIGKLALVPDEFVGELGLDLGFVHARFQKPADPRETLAGEMRRRPGWRQFHRRI